MRRSRFSWKLFLGNALLTGFVWGGLIWLNARHIEALYRDELRRQLTAQAELLSLQVADAMARGDVDEQRAWVRRVASLSHVALEAEFFAADGTDLAESSPVERDGSAERRPEIEAAIRDGWGARARVSPADGLLMQVVAIRVGDADRPVGVVSVSAPLTANPARAAATRRFVWTTALLALLAVVAWAVGVASLWRRSIQRITAAARRLTRGDLSARAELEGAEELAPLARALNRMREHLAAQLDAIDRQRRQFESILVQLQEGVVVATADGRIALINPAAVRLLDLEAMQAHAAAGLIGKSVEQCVPHHDLQKLLLQGAGRQRDHTNRPSRPSSAEPSDAHTAPGTDGETAMADVRLQLETASASVSVLARASDVILPGPGPDAPSNGRLLVLTDISELARAIQIKTDFVANASHELRTPLSAIRAAVESLAKTEVARKDGYPRRFLEVIDRHSRRLEALVADLLDLSRVESPAAQFEPVPVHAGDLLTELQERFADALKAKSLEWRIEAGSADVICSASPHLLRLILDNLIDNAIKFTEPGGMVGVACRRHADKVALAVFDTGCGIPPEEQARVFERFYQVERARSGTGSARPAPRGTGLGLSIVRHAVAAMNGAVELESEVGRGTRVTVTIPQPDEDRSAVR